VRGNRHLEREIDRSIDRAARPLPSHTHVHRQPTQVLLVLLLFQWVWNDPHCRVRRPWRIVLLRHFEIRISYVSPPPFPSEVRLSRTRTVHCSLFTVHKDPIVPSIHPARWGLCAQFGVNSCFSVLSTKLVTDYPHPHPHPHPLQHRQLDLRGYCQRAERCVRGFRSFVRRRLSRSDGSVQASRPPPSPYTFFCLLLLRIYDCSFVLQSRIRTWRRSCWCSRSI